MVYIICEGKDGSGKSTLVENIVAYLENEGFKVKGWFEPYLPEVLTLLDRLKAIKSTNPEYFYEIKDDVFAMIFTIDRNIMRTTLEDYLDDGVHVIADRSWLTTNTYQAEAGEKFLNKLEQHVIQPDCVIYLDVDVDVALERLQQRDGNKRDHFESRDNLVKASKKYLEVLSKYEFPVYHVNANRSMQEVFDSCIPIIKYHIQDEESK
jgi:dTMP kinase